VADNCYNIYDRMTYVLFIRVFCVSGDKFHNAQHNQALHSQSW